MKCLLGHAVVVVLVLLGGCASPSAKTPPPQAGKLTVGDLDQLTYAYADRYMSLVSSACDEIAQDNPSPDERLLAGRVKLINCSSIYDIATSPDAFSRLLDLTLVVTLQAQVWIDDGRAHRQFGDRAPYLEKALREARQEVWNIAAQALTPDQLEGFDRLILRWRRDNPDVQFVSYVRFNDVATGRARAIESSIRRGEGLMAPIDDAKQSVDAVRALAERMFYFGKRMPFLLDWQGNIFVEQMLQKPELQKVVQAVDQLPENVTAQRKALFEDLDKHQPAIADLIDRSRGAIDGINSAIKTTDQTLQHMTETSESLRKTLQQYDDMAKRYSATEPSTRPSKPFDITEWDKTAQSLEKAAVSINELVKSSDGLVSSPALGKRFNEVDSMAQARIQQAITESKGMVGFTVTQMVILCAIFFSFLLAYNLVAGWIRRRLASGEARK